jgi:hypothetical protein
MSESLVLPVISASWSESEFSAACTAVAALERDTKLWLADAALWAIERFGKEKGLQLVHEATGLKKCSLNHASYTAKAFPPEKRFDYNYNSLRFMKPFKNADATWTDDFLARHQADKVSSRDLRALAQKEYAGKDGEKKKPVKVKSSNKCSVTLTTSLYARLRMHSADRKISVLIEEICEQWLKQQSDVHKAAVAAPIIAERRPTYAERRKKQIESAESKPIAPKPSKNNTKLKRAWTDCSGPSFLDGEDGAIAIKAGKHDATKFKTEAEASAAEREFFETSGFHELVAYCEVCKAWHVRHVYNHPAEAQEKTAQIT